MTRPIGISHCTCSGLWRSGSVPYYPKTSFGGVCGANRLRTPLHCPPLLERSFLHQDYSTSRKVTKRSTSTNTKAKVNTINSSKSTGKGSTGCSKQGNNVTSKGKRPTGSSAQWIKRQLADPWAKLAADSHYASRSAFKLQQIDDKHRFLKPGRTVIDCGARPGGWSQVSVERCCRPPKNRSVKNFVPGVVISVDICEMNVVPGASLVTGDFTKADTQAEVTKILQGKRADVVLSDMAPPASGQPSVDFDRLMNLCDAVLNFTKGNLKPGGTLVVKLLGGGDIKDFRTSLTQTFQSVKFAKPAASRSSSSESFVVATGFTQPKSSVEGSGTMQREVKTD